MMHIIDEWPDNITEQRDKIQSHSITTTNLYTITNAISFNIMCSKKKHRKIILKNT